MTPVELKYYCCTIILLQCVRVKQRVVLKSSFTSRLGKVPYERRSKVEMTFSNRTELWNKLMVEVNPVRYDGVMIIASDISLVDSSVDL